jgi:superfamily II DNA or RNA helicase
MVQGVHSWHLRVAPRPWQEEALRLWKADSRGVVSVVTGGGKTVFAQMCMLAFRDEHPDGKFVIVVPTTALLDQWFISLQEDLGVPEEHISSFSGEEKAKEPNIVNILVLNTARELAPWIAEEHETFLIVDECHRAGSPVNAKALRGAHQAVLGLSATPEREYDEGFEQYVVPALGDIIFEYDYAQAFKEGVISPFELINVRVDLLADERQRYDKLSQRVAREIQRSETASLFSERLRRLLQQRAAVSALATMRIPVAAKLAESHRGQRTLIFHERVDQADTLRNVLAERGHRVTVYHSKIAPVVRRDNLRLYRHGMFDVLISCRALDEGMNVPETVVSIIASSTASTRQRIQRLGRVLRPAPGKSEATVYTIYATDQEERRLLREAQSFKEITQVEWVQASAGGRHD